MNATSMIPTPGLANSEELDRAHTALETAIADATQASSLAKQARSQLCEAPEFLAPPVVRPEMSRWDAERVNAAHLARKTAERDRRRMQYFVCYLRAVQCNNVLHTAIEAAATAVTALRETIATLGAAPSFEKQCAMANCFSADAQLLQARQLLRASRQEWSYYHLGEGEAQKYGPETIYLIPGVFVNPHEMLEAAHQASAREWMVLAGGGYGHDDPPAEPPAGPHLTLEEASDEGGHWIGHACTIGGTATCFNVRTREQKQP